MPLPAGVAAVLAQTAQVTGVGGSLADYTSLAFTGSSSRSGDLGVIGLPVGAAP